MVCWFLYDCVSIYYTDLTLSKEKVTVDDEDEEAVAMAAEVEET